VGVFNENRRLLRELYEIKRETPWLLSVDKAYCLMAVGGMIPREEHNQLLAWAIPQIRKGSATPQDRMRLVFTGGFCEQPDLAEAYLENSSYSPVQHDLRKPKEQMLLEQIKEAKAGAAIITAAKMCEPGLDEVVAYTKALDEEGIPYFVSEFEERMTNFDSLQIQLETFIENLLFASTETTNV